MPDAMKVLPRLRLRQDAWAMPARGGTPHGGQELRDVAARADLRRLPAGEAPSSGVMRRLGMRCTGLGRWHDMDCSRDDITGAQSAQSPDRARQDAEA